jgi:hypothetical protein
MEITNFKENPLTERANKGGLCSFQFAPVEWVETMPLAADGEYLGTVDFISGKTWLSGYATKDTLNWVEEENNELYKPALKGFCPTDEPDNLALFASMKKTTYIILCKDRHGRYVLSGKPDGGLFFTFKRSKGNIGDNHHGQDFEFGGAVLPWPSYYYGV